MSLFRDNEDLMRMAAMGMDVGAGITASILSPQLGSDAEVLARGKTDMRRLTVIQKEDLTNLIYMKLRARKSRLFATIYDEILNLNVSIGGRGRRDIIRMEGVSKGGMVNVEAEIQKPGLLARNTWNRDWERKELERLERQGL